jgi:hypothetical protein
MSPKLFKWDSAGEVHPHRPGISGMSTLKRHLGNPNCLGHSAAPGAACTEQGSVSKVPFWGHLHRIIRDTF